MGKTRESENGATIKRQDVEGGRKGSGAVKTINIPRKVCNNLHASEFSLTPVMTSWKTDEVLYKELHFLQLQIKGKMFSMSSVRATETTPSDSACDKAGNK